MTIVGSSNIVDQLTSARDVNQSARASEARAYQPHTDAGKIGVAELTSAISRLSGTDLDGALRYRAVPFDLGPGKPVGYAVDSGTGLDHARRHDLHIASVVPRGWMLQALMAAAGPAILDHACNGLARRMPSFSASRRMSAMQAVTLAVIAGLSVALAVTNRWFALALMLGLAVMFLSQAALRISSIGRHAPARGLRLSNGDAAELPAYSVLVPLFRETEIVDQLLQALKLIDYPADRLDIKLILEESDHETRQHIAAISLPEHFECIVVPHALPLTKPKALNFALPFARGELVTIFDAEDIPEAWQLRQAAMTFAASDPDIVCLQAHLAFYNADENPITQQFAIEYAILFDQLLPLLASLGLPLPLGGTSNHFRISALRRVGGWDPHNVTEDADLGFRLMRMGYRAAVIPTSTYEEANCQFGNWMAQRVRWLKGWLQNWLVHMRRPRRTWNELGAGGFATMQIVLGGALLSSLLHPLFLGLVIWAIASGDWTSASDGLLKAMSTGLSLVVLITGYGFVMTAGFAALRRRRLPVSPATLLLMPVYWLMISVAAWAAVWQFFTAPFKWNKTRHGLSRVVTPPR